MTNEDRSQSFEASMKRLDEIVKALDGGNVPLEQALQLFREGTALVERCHKQLDDAELEVVRLTKGPDGAPVEERIGNDAE